MNDRSVLITAGASGIGREMGNTFASAGWRVWVTDVDASALATCPTDWHADLVDVSDETAMADLFSRVKQAWGTLDALCANAGVAGETALVENQDIPAFRRCLETNLVGAMIALKEAVPIMKAAGQGCILFIGSTSGVFGTPFRAPYVASKWALNGLMKTVAMEAGPYGIRANVIAPGCVEGPRIDAVIAREARAKGTTPDVVRNAYLAGTSLRTFSTAEDIAAMALFLASETGKRISGQVIVVDGHTENPDPRV
jgi:NAD(P)-dependent dehydrogenase (short-subunit alcohol dehydrogenase family)